MTSARFRPFVGGTETHTYEVGCRMVERGHNVTVLTTRPDYDLPSRELIDGIHVVRVRTVLPKTDFYIAPSMFRTIAGGRWDIVHCQGYHTLVAPLTMAAALRARKPFVLSFHSGGHSSSLRVGVRGVQRSLLRPMLARARRLIAVSAFEATFFARELHLPTSRFSVVVNGAARLPAAMESSASSDSKDPLIVSVGRLERYKGHQRVIDAMPLVLQAFPNARLRVVGNGPYEPELKQLTTNLGLSDSVDICGTTASDKQGMARVLSQAALVTLISDYEAYPIAVLEALAMGCQVLLADTSGLSELGKYSAVTLVQHAVSRDELAAAIIHRLREPLQGIEVTLPSWDDCTEGILGIYREVLGAPACAS